MFKVRLWFWPHGKQDKIDPQDRDEEESCLGLFHVGTVDPVGGASPAALGDAIRLQLGPQHPHDVEEEDDVEGDDEDDGDDQEEVGVLELGPAQSVINLIDPAVVGDDNEERRDPAHHQHPPHPLLVVVEDVHEEELEVGSLAQHPEVGGEGEVVGGHVDREAPGQAGRGALGLNEDVDHEVVGQPGKVTEDTVPHKTDLIGQGENLSPSHI